MQCAAGLNRGCILAAGQRRFRRCQRSAAPNADIHIPRHRNRREAIRAGQVRPHRQSKVPVQRDRSARVVFVEIHLRLVAIVPIVAVRVIHPAKRIAAVDPVCRIGHTAHGKLSDLVLRGEAQRGRYLDCISGGIGRSVAAQPVFEDIARPAGFRQGVRLPLGNGRVLLGIGIAVAVEVPVVLQHYADLPVALPHSVEVRLKLVVILKAIRRTARRRIVDRRGILRLRPAEQSLIAVREGIHVRAEVEVVGLRGRNECVLIISRHTAIAVQRQYALPHLIGDVGSIIIGVVRDRHCVFLVLAAAD